MKVYDKFLKSAQDRGKRQKKLIKIYVVVTLLGAIALYLLVRPIGPMREIGMWAALSQLFFCAGFGFLLASELYMQKTNGSETE